MFTAFLLFVSISLPNGVVAGTFLQGYTTMEGCQAEIPSAQLVVRERAIFAGNDNPYVVAHCFKHEVKADGTI